jgi:hypothetical protein
MFLHQPASITPGRGELTIPIGIEPDGIRRGDDTSGPVL